ncbi:type II secretion system F family protein [Actinobacteria bacterium YIM 96077]|uniref:Pilus assembly protein TadB n=1 Tax=Phytoactinopolyspora halophila TaxID=1981511 RepID=A0A329R3Q4_9ACTN|nr:type II secretion system F family protein [Phytoactinopolyspora halophila]AYY12086.1 type II secretion system F family protein [Actinobacteria bacterium YIM 96077]RAW18679.1 pilus assembly protein TadB [Phytoactinopolyspora halophila]
MSAVTTGALIGAGVGTGMLLIWSRLPFRNRPSLHERLAPYVGDRADEHVERALAEPVFTPFPTLERIVRPYVVRAASWLERLLGGGASVRRRLEQAGREQTLHEFRIQQLLWAATTAAGGIAVSLLLLASGYTGSPILLLAFSLAAAIAGVIAYDHRLSAAVRERERRIMAEFPTVADLLALSVAAGDGPVKALERVVWASRGELAGELRRALSDARAGSGLVEALDRIAQRTNLTSLARFVDGIAVAVERGTPLADVLRAQASDVREQRKRTLMAIGGRKEISMMIPIVFIVMPVTILFALYPGVVQISTVVP